jgi:hypothetical protein
MSIPPELSFFRLADIPFCLDIFPQYCYDVGNVEEGLPVGGFPKIAS